MPLIVCRHTQTDDNVAGRLSGQTDVPLNTNGRVQVVEVTAGVTRYDNIRAVICSDAVRARELGEAIGLRAGVRPFHTATLREVRLGEASRLTPAEVQRRYPGKRHSTRHPGFDFRDIGGECHGQVVRRQLLAIRWIARVFGEAGVDPLLDHVVMVGHGTALRVLLQDHFHALKGELHPQGRFQVFPWPLAR